MPLTAIRRLGPPSRRLLPPRFFGADDDGAGSDDGQGAIILPVWIFENQPNPDAVPAFGPNPPQPGVPNGPVGIDSGLGRMYFNQVAVGGIGFNQKFVRIPLDPNAYSCNQLSPPVPDGDVHALGSSNITRDPDTGLITGSLHLSVTAFGTLPGPGGNAPVLDNSRSADTYSEAAFLAAVSLLGAWPVADTITEGYTPGTLLRLYNGGRDGGTGYFVQGFMNTVPCLSTMIFTYLDPYALVSSPTVFGDPARTQHITGFVPDGAGGGTYQGDVSRVRVQFVSPTGTATYFYTFLVTPDDGSDPYRVTWSEYRTVPAGSFQEIGVEFPVITGATVYLESYELLFNEELGEDWEAYETGNYTALAAGGAWPDEITFGLGGFWDDFENWTGDSLTNLRDLLTGNWPDAGTISSLDDENASDDFENYPAGAITILNRGIGWPTVGTVQELFVYQAYDDFEAEPAGAIAELPASLSNYNRWPDVGVFGPVNYASAWDDFESYAAGPIPDLPVPADPDNHWSATGTFG